MWQSQRRNILWRQGGKDSHWGIDNGLRAMIHLGLNMALMGYDIQIPDMIPGRVQTMVADMALPTDELFIRWTEASAFWPIMQFSYYPWNYAKPTADAARGVALAHKAIEEYIGQQATSRSAPLIRPMWYDHPSVEPFYAIGDQFMLGSDLVIAPVVSPGATCRDVFLPPGRWRDAWTGQDPADGRQTQMDAGSVRHLADYPAPCPGLPVFVRAENTALFDSLHGALSRIERGTVPPGVTTATYLAGVNRDLNVTG
jgi:alpha-glucosidase (family GH31 glycosyl hydrolase)